MFKLNDKYELDGRISKNVYVNFSPAETSTKNTTYDQTYFKLPRKDSVISLSYGYLDLNFEVVITADNSRYANGNVIRLVHLGPLAFFGNNRLTTGLGKTSEDVRQAHIVTFNYKLMTSSAQDDNLSIGFDRDRDRKQRELTFNKNVKRKLHIRSLLEDVFVFAFAEHQKKAALDQDKNKN